MPAARRDPILHQTAEQAVERTLAEFSRVEPRPEMVHAWARVPARISEEGGWWRRPAAVPAAAWAALALAALLLLGFAWYRARRHPSEPALAGSRIVLVPVAPVNGEPITGDQKRLLQLLQSDPAALANQQPAPPAPRAAAAKPKGH